jgi:hypothetical protein
MPSSSHKSAATARPTRASSRVALVARRPPSGARETSRFMNRAARGRLRFHRDSESLVEGAPSRLPPTSVTSPPFPRPAGEPEPFDWRRWRRRRAGGVRGSCLYARQCACGDADRARLSEREGVHALRARRTRPRRPGSRPRTHASVRTRSGAAHTHVRVPVTCQSRRMVRLLSLAGLHGTLDSGLERSRAERASPPSISPSLLPGRRADRAEGGRGSVG